MKILDLKRHLQDIPVFSIKDIRKIEPKFYSHQLTEWQKKNYIRKIIKGFYCFSDLEVRESELFLFANKIFKPSYVSMETALSFYGLIPESVFAIMSVSPKNSRSFSSQFGEFYYRKIKPEYFFGYNLVQLEKYCYSIADFEKSILDYFYLNSKFKTKDDIREARFNHEVIREKLNEEKMQEYLIRFGSSILSRRILLLKELVREELTSNAQSG